MGITHIQFHHAPEGGQVFATHLPETRQSGSDTESFLMPEVEFPGFVWQAWTWTHQTHIAADNIDELRKLIDTQIADQGHSGDDARITLPIQLGQGAIRGD